MRWDHSRMHVQSASRQVSNYFSSLIRIQSVGGIKLRAMQREARTRGESVVLLNFLISRPKDLGFRGNPLRKLKQTSGKILTTSFLELEQIPTNSQTFRLYILFCKNFLYKNVRLKNAQNLRTSKEHTLRKDEQLCFWISTDIRQCNIFTYTCLYTPFFK